MNFCKDEVGKGKSKCSEGLELPGSHFALQVALQTLKERCHRLQQRISSLEEENARLKLRKHDCEPDIHSTGDSEQIQLGQLKEQVSQLTRQKSQLSHQIIMVVTENKQLWNRLSHMTKVNKSLGSHLSKISDTLNQHTSGPTSNSPKKSKGGDLKPMAQKSDISSLTSRTTNIEPIAYRKSGSEQNSPRPIDSSLEEISLKLLNSIQLEKSELEQQYAQMVEINNDTSPSFNLTTMGLSFIYEDENHAVKLIKENCKDLEKMKQALLEQQITLKNAVSKVTALKEAQGKICCHQCLKKHGKWKEKDAMNADDTNENALKLNDGGELKYKDQWTEDLTADKLDKSHSVGQKETLNTAATQEQMYTCPLCGMNLAHSTPFEVFQKHVTEHFPPDNYDTSLANDFDVL
ncbi:protein spindle-F [Hetaerina americana]|uniref:protein spindle-F n=1 Tax=Hetaerina americana TaxID=62018 RepID=UPI003A7F43CD